MDMPIQTVTDDSVFQNPVNHTGIEHTEVSISSKRGIKSISTISNTTLNSVIGNDIVDIPLKKNVLDNLVSVGLSNQPAAFNLLGKKLVVLLSTKKLDSNSMKNPLQSGNPNTSNSNGVYVNIATDKPNSSKKVSDLVLNASTDTFFPTIIDTKTKKLSKGHRCYFCGHRFFDKKLLKRHIASHKDRPYTCDICDKTFADKAVLRKHNFCHTGERRFMCESCGKTYIYNWDLQKHIESSHSGVEQRCTTCFKKIRSRTDNQCWQCINEGKKITTDGKYVCTICNLYFNSLSLLNEHFHVHQLKNKSSESLPCCSTDGTGLFSCRTCGRVCKSSTTLKSHLLSHSKERPFICEHCNGKFKSLDGLKHHMASHIQEKPYVCSTCQSSFKSPHRLKKHILNHSEVRPFVCDVCGSSFKSSCVLKKHLVTHNSNKPFVCNTCGNRFKSTYSLKQHFIVHSSERPYVCSMCNKSYKFLSNHLRHQRSHTGECPYQCIICNKSFSQANSLRMHMVVHSKDCNF